MKRIDRFTSISEGGLWLIRMRWLAVIGILVAATFTDFILKIPVQKTPIYILTAILLLFNVISFYSLQYAIRGKLHFKIFKIENIVKFQILTDLVILTCLLHFSGGVENPLVIYYVFHMIIASILLSPKSSYAITTIALMLVGTLTLLEFHEIIPHYHLQGFIGPNFYQNQAFLLGTGFVYVTTSYLIVYMTVSMSTKLRQHDEAYTKATFELEKKDKIKNEYVLRLTHDIKGHVAAIQNCLDVVLLSTSADHKQEFAKRAYKRAQKLTNFINELLKLTRLRLSNVLDTCECSIDELIEIVIQELAPMASKKRIRIIFNNKSQSKKIPGNKLSIEEALSNLVSNAIKYSPDASEITVEVQTKRNFIIIEIIDNGYGIPPHEQKMIFNEFYRASNVEHIEKESSGIGLSLVKQIIELHNGTISVDSKLNKGTRFKISLPAAKSK